MAMDNIFHSFYFFIQNMFCPPTLSNDNTLMNDNTVSFDNTVSNDNTLMNDNTLSFDNTKPFCYTKSTHSLMYSSFESSSNESLYGMYIDIDIENI